MQYCKMWSFVSLVFALTVLNSLEAMRGPRDFYKVLGLATNATRPEIRSAYLRLAKTVHPDRGGNEVEFVEAQNAYETLMNDDLRHQYDQELNRQRAKWQKEEKERQEEKLKAERRQQEFQQELQRRREQEQRRKREEQNRRNEEELRTSSLKQALDELRAQQREIEFKKEASAREERKSEADKNRWQAEVARYLKMMEESKKKAEESEQKIRKTRQEKEAMLEKEKAVEREIKKAEEELSTEQSKLKEEEKIRDLEEQTRKLWEEKEEAKTALKQIFEKDLNSPGRFDLIFEYHTIKHKNFLATKKLLDNKSVTESQKVSLLKELVNDAFAEKKEKEGYFKSLLSEVFGGHIKIADRYQVSALETLFEVLIEYPTSKALIDREFEKIAPANLKQTDLELKNIYQKVVDYPRINSISPHLKEKMQKKLKEMGYIVN